MREGASLPFPTRRLLLAGALLLCFGVVGCAHRGRPSAAAVPGAPTGAPPPSGLLIPDDSVPPPKAPRARATEAPEVVTPPRPPTAAQPPPPPRKPSAAPLPAQVAALEEFSRAPFLTRATLARFLDALPKRGKAGHADPPIMTDILDHPWRAEIIGAVRRGTLAPYPNHQFKPEGLVTRAELAVALRRTADSLGITDDGRGRPVPRDVPESNPLHGPIRFAASTGLLPLASDGHFNPSRPVSGDEGWSAIRRFCDLIASPR